MMGCGGGEIQGRRMRGGTWGICEQGDVRAEDLDTIVAFLEHRVMRVDSQASSKDRAASRRAWGRR